MWLEALLDGAQQTHLKVEENGRGGFAYTH